MKKCVKCKLEFSDEFDFCPECGSKLEKKDDKLDLFEDFNDSDTTDLNNLDDLFDLDNVTFADSNSNNNNENINLDSLDNDLVMQAELAYSKKDYEKAKKIYEQLIDKTNYSFDIIEKYIKTISVNYTKVDYSFIPLITKFFKNKDFSKHVKKGTEFYNYINKYKIHLISLFKILLDKIYIQKNEENIKKKKEEDLKKAQEIIARMEKLAKEEDFKKNAYNCQIMPPEYCDSTHNRVIFGTYNNTPIKWECIGTFNYCILLITSSSIGAFKFNENGCSNYEDSSLRKYINNDFYNECFSEKEKEIILKSPKTLDNVFILSGDGYDRYIYDYKKVYTSGSYWTRDTEHVTGDIFMTKVRRGSNSDSTLTQDSYASLRPCILIKQYKENYLTPEGVKEKLEYEKSLEKALNDLKDKEEEKKKKELKEEKQFSIFNYKKNDDKYIIFGLSEVGKNIKDLDLVIPPFNTELDIEIKENAFAEMQNIRSVTIKGNIELNSRTFYNCHNLEKVNLNDKVWTIHKECFSGTNLKEIDLKEVRQIDEYAFANCPLKNFVFPKYIEIFNILALENCNNLEKISSKTENYYIDKNSIIYHRYQKNAFALIGSISKEKTIHVLNSIPIPSLDYVTHEIVNRIDENAFKGNKYIEQLYGNENIRVIAPHAFENCINLKQIDGFSYLDEVKECAFKNDYNLEEVLSFDKSIINIGYHAFADCKSLKKLYVSKHSRIHDEAFDSKHICKKRLFK